MCFKPQILLADPHILSVLWVQSPSLLYFLLTPQKLTRAALQNRSKRCHRCRVVGVASASLHRGISASRHLRMHLAPWPCLHMCALSDARDEISLQWLLPLPRCFLFINYNFMITNIFVEYSLALFGPHCRQLSSARWLSPVSGCCRLPGALNIKVSETRRETPGLALEIGSALRAARTPRVFGPWRVSSFVFTLIEELFGRGTSMSRLLPVFSPWLDR